MDKKPYRYAVIGYPLGHSISPEIHNPAFRYLDIPARYLKYEIPPESFDREIEKLKRQSWAGFNVTIPFKERILVHLDEVETLSDRIGAVNTIVITENGSWKGYNTDYDGFLGPIGADLHALESCTIVGAGGAARAVAFGIVSKAVNLKTLRFLNRTPEKARELARTLKMFKEIPVYISPLHETSMETIPADLVVNTTSVGMGELAGQMPVNPVNLLKPGGIAYDLIYNPAETLFLKSAREAGFRTINGLPMLIGQGARSFELWTRREFPAAVRKQLCIG